MDTVTIKQLAKELNVSISTVSRALSDSYDISAATKQRVMTLAKELNFEPNPYASSLRRQKSKTIAVIVPEINNNFFSLALNGIQTVAQERGYHVLIYATHESYAQEQAIINHLQCGRVDGVLLSLSSETEDTKHLQKLEERGVPLVFFDRVCQGMEAAKVTTDDYESAFKATEHLIEQGCTRPAYLSIFKNLSISVLRKQGYLAALKKYGFERGEKSVVHCTGDNEKNNALITELLKNPQRPDGIFAAVERLALSTYQVCNLLQLSIPEEVKVVSFSNLETAPLLQPSLTTITQPAFQMGREAAVILFQSFKRKSNAIKNEKIVLQSVLVKRTSTALPAVAKNKIVA